MWASTAKGNVWFGFCLVWAMAGTGNVWPETVECGHAGPGTVLVADPAAGGGQAVAVEIGDAGEKSVGKWLLSEKPLAPGLYAAAARVKLWMPPDYDLSRLECSVRLEGQGVSQSIPLRTYGINSSREDYTVAQREMVLLQPTPLGASFEWRVAPVQAGQRPMPARPVKLPKADTGDGGNPVGTDSGHQSDELLDGLQAQSATPLRQIAYPACLLDQLTFEPISRTVIVETVRPQKVHVYPGEPNPITVTLRNFDGHTAQTTVRLSVWAGLDEFLGAQDAAVEIPAGGTASRRFEWTAGQREYGHEARAEAFVAGNRAHVRSDYFSVSTPVWKTAIQGNGFISWYGLEHELAPHVEENRRNYVNVEEAFSWQPSSWSDLNPTTDHWWAGQNNFHNSMRGLREWIARSHAHGIKMISYLLPMTSGPTGLEWARRHPEVLARAEIGLNATFDVEDLRLYPARMADPALWDYQPDIWNRIGIHRGLLKTSVLGADEVIRSAKGFGWDGVRFDGHPTWGSMPAEAVHQEIQELGLEDLMQQLVPEYFATRQGKWTGSAISIRNIRYMKHRFTTEIGSHFAVSGNHELVTSTSPVGPKGQVGFDYFRSFCSGGCQINQEVLRKCGDWPTFIDHLLTQVDFVRQCGGYHATQSIDKARGNGAACTFMNVFIFAAGSHPYCYAPVPVGLGQYSEFMTRYGEFCWDPGLKPVSPEDAGLDVTGVDGLEWRRWVRQRLSPGGRKETVVHLISPPRSDSVVSAAPVPMPAWRRSISVAKRCPGTPAVWRLSAEPDVRAERLPVTEKGGASVVVVPEHRLWTLLVWVEQGEGQENRP